jgi:hypothetical protein
LNLRSGSTIEPTDIKNLKILRIYPKDDIYLNVYFTIELDGEKEPYYGVIKKINTKNPQVFCELFNDRKIFHSKEWVIRVKGNITKSIKKWLNVDRIKYQSLKDIDAYNENTGELELIPIGSMVEVIRSIDDYITINYMENNYILTGRNYYYFNYYFQPTQD